MDYSQFLNMREELSLIAVLLLLFLADLFMSPDAHKNSGKARLNTMLPVILMAIHTAINLIPGTATDAFGGMYHYVPMHTVVKSILNVGTLIVFLMAHEWMKREDTSFKQGEFYVLTLSTLFGMYLMISAGHFLLLFGLSMIYGSAGTLYFDDLPAHIDGNPLQIMAFIFFFTGMAFKLSLVPFHLWTADVYEGAPSTVTAYLSVISKGSAAFVLLAVLIKVFAPMINDWQEVLYWVTIASITIANIFAVRQQNLKRLMAFSSISQAGYIMLGVIGGTAQGMTALVYYVLVYAAANLGVFAVITIVALRSQKFTLEDYAGLYKTNPKIALLMTLSLFSLAGIPPFAGFFSKFFIFMAAFDAGFHLLVFIALVNTVISLYYYLLIVKAMYITPSDNPIPTFRSDRCTKWGLALCTLGIIGLGIASIVYQSIDKLSFGI